MINLTILAIMAMSSPAKWTLGIIVVLVIIAVIMILSKKVKDYLNSLDDNDQSTLMSKDSTSTHEQLHTDRPNKVEWKVNVDTIKAEDELQKAATSQSDVVLEANDLKDNKGLQAIEESPNVNGIFLQSIKEKFLSNRTRNQVKDWLVYTHNKTESEAEQLVKKTLKRYEMAYDHDTQHYDFKINIEARRKPSN